MSRVAHGDVRQKILEAAEHRLWHYGFKKTTIDEIAADAGVGKGTVYLYFDSKEDIALAIVTQFKVESNKELQRIAASGAVSVEKLKWMLIRPAVMAYDRCLRSPAARELVVEVRPHIQARLQPYQEQEIGLLAAVLEEGNRRGEFSVADPVQSARTLKMMCAGFWPPYPLVEGAEAIEAGIGNIVNLAFCGLCHPQERSRHCPSE